MSTIPGWHPSSLIQQMEYLKNNPNYKGPVTQIGVNNLSTMQPRVNPSNGAVLGYDPVNSELLARARAMASTGYKNLMGPGAIPVFPNKPSMPPGAPGLGRRFGTTFQDPNQPDQVNGFGGGLQALMGQGAPVTTATTDTRPFGRGNFGGAPMDRPNIMPMPWEQAGTTALASRPNEQMLSGPQAARTNPDGSVTGKGLTPEDIANLRQWLAADPSQSGIVGRILGMVNPDTGDPLGLDLGDPNNIVDYLDVLKNAGYDVGQLDKQNTPGNISGLQGNLTTWLQNYLGGGGTNIQSATNGINNLIGQFGGDLVGRASGNIAPGQIDTSQIGRLTSGTAGSQTADLYNQRIQEVLNGTLQNPNQQLLSDQARYLIGQNKLPTFGQSTYDPATGQSFSGTLTDQVQNQLAALVTGRNQPANTGGIQDAVTQLLNRIKNPATAGNPNGGNSVDQALASFTSGPTADIASLFGQRVGSGLSATDDLNLRARQIANSVGDWNVAGTSSLAKQIENLLGNAGGQVPTGQVSSDPSSRDAAWYASQLAQMNVDPSQVSADNIGPSSYLGGAADLARQLATQNINPSQVSARDIGPSSYLGGAADLAQRLSNQNIDPGRVSTENIGPSSYLGGVADLVQRLSNQNIDPGRVSANQIGGNSALDRAISGASGSQISPELQQYINSSMSGGLPTGFADAFKRQVYDPQREALLGDLSRRGVLDSSERLKKERELFNNQFSDILATKALDQGNVGAGLATQAAGLNQNAIAQLLGASGQQTDIAGRNQALALQANLANQDAALRAAGLLGTNVGRGADLLLGASGQANDVSGRNQALALQANLANQDAALRAAGLIGTNTGRGADLMLAASGQANDLSGRNQSAGLQAAISNQDAALRAAGLIGANTGRGADLLLGASGQSNDIGGRNQAANLAARTSNQDAALRAAGLRAGNLGQGSGLLLNAGNSANDLGRFNLTNSQGVAQQNIQNQLQRILAGGNLQQQAFGQSTGAAQLLGGLGAQQYGQAQSNFTTPASTILQGINAAQNRENSTFSNINSGYGSTTDSLTRLLGLGAQTGQTAQQLRNQEFGLGLDASNQVSQNLFGGLDRGYNAAGQSLANSQYNVGQANQTGQFNQSQVLQALLANMGSGNQVNQSNRDAALAALGVQSSLLGGQQTYGTNTTQLGYQNAIDLIGQQLNKEAGIYSADQARRGAAAQGTGSAIGGVAGGIAGIIAAIINSRKPVVSSEIFKDEIESFTDTAGALERVNSIPLAKFKYLWDQDKKRVGWINERVAPDFVEPDGLHVDTVSVMGHLVASIQEMSKEIARLRALVEAK